MKSRALVLVVAAAAAGIVAWRLLASRVSPDAGAPPSARANATTSSAPAPRPVAVAEAGSQPARGVAEIAGARQTRDGRAASPLDLPADATLVVTVIERGTLRPIADARLAVSLQSAPPPRAAALANESANANASAPEETNEPTADGDWVSRVEPMATDAQGEATVPVPSGVRLDVQARDAAGNAFARVDAASADVIAPLAPGETRRVRLEVRATSAGPVFGIVVVEDEGTPVAGARIQPRDGEAVVADAAGRFTLERRPGVPVGGRVEAEGFSLALFQVNDGHGDPGSALRVELARAVSLDALVQAADGSPVAGAVVRLLAEPFEVSRGPQWVFGEAVQWKGTTGADGRCAIAGLPYGVKLRAEVWSGEKRLRKEPAPIVIAKASTGRYECRLGAGTRLVGAVIDQHDKPVAGEEIWCVGEDRGRVREAPAEARYFDAIDASRVAAKAVTDGEGRFAIDDVPPGSLWIGVAARPRGDARSDASVSPRAVRVRVDGGAREQEVVLRVHRGVFITGRVLRSNGEAAAGATVFAIGEGMSSAMNTASGDGGAFALGPLSPGSFQLTAAAFQNDAPSDYVRAEAGAADVMLRLVAAGAIRGTVVDAASGKPVEAMQRLFRRGQKGAWSTFTAQRGAEIDHEGVVPGTYDLVATTTDGRFAARHGIVVEAGRDVTGVELRLAPAARLRMRYEGARPWVDVEVRDAEGLVESVMVPAGKTVVIVVPPGSLRARVGFRGTVVTEREASVELGREAELALKDP